MKEDTILILLAEKLLLVLKEAESIDPIKEGYERGRRRKLAKKTAKVILAYLED